MLMTPELVRHKTGMASTPHILVVEDDREISALVARYLQANEESMQNRGVITPPLLLPWHRPQAGSPDSVDGKRPRVCRSARRCARRGRAAPSLCSSAFTGPCSCAWPRSH